MKGILIWLLVFVSYGWAWDNDEFAKNCNPDISGAERIRNLHALLRNEVKTPTLRFETGSGDYVGHDYLLMNLAIACGYAAREGDLARAILKRSAEKETEPLVRKVLFLALGEAGDKFASKELATILKMPDLSHVVKRAATNLFELEGSCALPELVNGLEGPAAGHVAGLIRKCGISVSTSHDENGIKFHVNRAAVVGALSKELVADDSKRSMGALEAIGRVGGVEAKRELETFVKKNEGIPDRENYVRKAKEALLLMKVR